MSKIVTAPCIYCGKPVEKEIVGDNGYPVDQDYQWCVGCEPNHIVKQYTIKELKMWNGSFNWIVSIDGNDEWRQFYEDNGDSIETACAYAEAYGYEYKETIREWED